MLILWKLFRFAATDALVVDQFNSSDAFGQLLAAATRVSEQHTEMPGADIAAMYIALGNFVGAVYPDHLDYINRLLESCYEVHHLERNSQNFHTTCCRHNLD